MVTLIRVTLTDIKQKIIFEDIHWKNPLTRGGTRICTFYDHFNLVLENATRKIATKPGGTICNRLISTWPMQMT